MYIMPLIIINNDLSQFLGNSYVKGGFGCCANGTVGEAPRLSGGYLNCQNSSVLTMA